MTLAITPIYAGLLALLFLALSLRVVRHRRANQISLMDGGDSKMLQLQRAQANCAEYAPIGLILLLVAELQGAPAAALHLLGSMLLAGRFAHGLAFLSFPMNMRMRFAGMVLTFLMILGTALGLLAHAVL